MLRDSSNCQPNAANFEEDLAAITEEVKQLNLSKKSQLPRTLSDEKRQPVSQNDLIAKNDELRAEINKQLCIESKKYDILQKREKNVQLYSRLSGRHSFDFANITREQLKRMTHQAKQENNRLKNKVQEQSQKSSTAAKEPSNQDGRHLNLPPSQQYSPEQSMSSHSPASLDLQHNLGQSPLGETSHEGYPQVSGVGYYPAVQQNPPRSSHGNCLIMSLPSAQPMPPPSPPLLEPEILALLAPDKDIPPAMDVVCLL